MGSLALLIQKNDSHFEILKQFFFNFGFLQQLSKFSLAAHYAILSDGGFQGGIDSGSQLLAHYGKYCLCLLCLDEWMYLQKQLRAMPSGNPAWKSPSPFHYVISLNILISLIYK